MAKSGRWIPATLAAVLAAGWVVGYAGYRSGQAGVATCPYAGADGDRNGGVVVCPYSGGRGRTAETPECPFEDGRGSDTPTAQEMKRKV